LGGLETPGEVMSIIDGIQFHVNGQCNVTRKLRKRHDSRSLLSSAHICKGMNRRLAKGSEESSIYEDLFV
jgi:hypothetical protein